MDYARFEELRLKTCEEFERGLEDARDHPRDVTYEGLERLAVQYRQLLHDHALASSRYPNTSMAKRLTRLVLAGTHYLQRETADAAPSLVRFLTLTFPSAMRRLSPLIAVMVSFFIVTCFFGFCLATVEPALGISFLGPGAIEGLKQNQLWTDSLFSVTPGSVASSFIATNNISVAFTAWAGGAVAGLGAIYVVLINGLMLGSVLAVTARYAMLGRLAEFIAAHGPLELSLIVIAAAAGMLMGKALVVADDRPRVEILAEATRDALVVLVGIVPWIFLLGFVEGYISPAKEIDVAFKAALGLLLEVSFLTVAFNPFGLGTKTGLGTKDK